MTLLFFDIANLHMLWVSSAPRIRDSRCAVIPRMGNINGVFLISGEKLKGLLVEQIQLSGPGCGFHPAADPQLAVDAAGVFLHRLARDNQFFGDLAIRQASCQ